VIEWLPMMSVDVLNVAVVTPPVVESEGVPSVVDPSLNVTVPVGLPLPGEVTDTVAVNVTDCPKLDGLALEETLVVVLDWLTVCVIADDVLEAKLVTPP